MKSGCSDQQTEEDGRSTLFTETFSYILTGFMLCHIISIRFTRMKKEKNVLNWQKHTHTRGSNCSYLVISVVLSCFHPIFFFICMCCPLTSVKHSLTRLFEHFSNKQGLACRGERVKRREAETGARPGQNLVCGRTAFGEGA